MKPKVRDHYHSHRMSYWLNLFPHLQSSSESLITAKMSSIDSSVATSAVGSSSSAESTASYYYYKHHLLPDHENPSTYDGIVREISLRFYDSNSPFSPASSSSSSSVHPSTNTSFSLSRNHWNKSNSSFLSLSLSRSTIVHTFSFSMSTEPESLSWFLSSSLIPFPDSSSHYFHRPFSESSLIKLIRVLPLLFTLPLRLLSVHDHSP